MKPEENLPEGFIALNLGVRLFAWIVTGVLVAMLMYGKKEARGGERSSKVKSIGLAASVINLLIWAGITYWFFAHYAEFHGK